MNPNLRHLQIAHQLKIIEHNKMTWRQVTSELIEVCFNGSLDENCARVEQDLFNAGAFAVKRRYDKKLNKTFTTYKRP